jgi:hypothetical protein
LRDRIALAELERMDAASARDLACAFTAGRRISPTRMPLWCVARFDHRFWKYGRHRKAYKSVLMDSGRGPGVLSDGNTSWPARSHRSH